jgi:predicted enzyme related to lactoylglutathione lyase
MTSRFAQWTLDVHDVDRMAKFWSAVLGYRIERESDGIVHLRSDDGGLSVWLQPTDTAKAGKNRDHPDLVADGGDVEGEVARLLALGATRADVGQTGDEGFTVFADPEGNEFCLLHRR